MANEEELAILKQGVEAWNEWRYKIPLMIYDLSNADLSGVNLSNADLSGGDLRGADLSGVNLSNADLGGADLGGADLSNADLSGAPKLFDAGADLSGADLFNANLSGANLRGANFSNARLSSTDLSGANLVGAKLNGAHLFFANLNGAHLNDAHLKYADLSGANLLNANLSGADIARARFYETKLEGTNFKDVEGAPRAKGLETTHHKSDSYFFNCIRKWPERFFDWERFRTVGHLPFFGASYTVLILIPIFFYGLALYNDKVKLFREWAKEIAQQQNHESYQLAQAVLDHLHTQPIPSLSLTLLVSTILLAIGSTCYAVACPARIKEFSRDVWVDQLNKPLIHYWPLAWKHRTIRLVSLTCYLFGGLGALYVIATKLWHSAEFIWVNSTLPWAHM